MHNDSSQRSRARSREIQMATSELEQLCVNLIEWEVVTGSSSGDGSAPTADTSDDDDLQVLEPYGFAGRPEGNSTTLALAPGGEVQGRVALGLSSPGGRPSTDPGDVAMWSVGGHTILFDNDSDLTITAKDGSSVVMASSGAITITAGTGASITITVDDGQSVNIGDLGAVKLLRSLAAENHIAAALRYGTQPGNFVPNDGGVLALTNVANFIEGTAAIPPAILGNSLTVAAGTEKAKGS